MSDHRIRLSDEQIFMIISSLRARRAGYAPTQQLKLDFLVMRLEEGARGNPHWILGETQKRKADEYVREFLEKRGKRA